MITQAKTIVRKRVRDYIKSFMSADGRFRVSLIDSTDCLKSYINRFHLNPDGNDVHYQASTLMGKSMSASLLLSSLLKGEERIKLEVFMHNNHPTIHHIVAEAIQVGEVRGFVSFKDSPKDFVDDTHSVFSVSRVLMEHSKPVVSALPLSDKADVTTEFREFFEKSEQIPTASTLVCKKEMGRDPISYGVIVQRLPLPVLSSHIIANDDISGFSEIEDQLNEYKEKLSKLEGKIFSREDIHEHLFYKFFVPEEASTVRYKPVDFFCRCSKDRVLEAVSQIGVEEITSMRNELLETNKPSFDSTCEYCNTTYHLNEEDLYSLINKISH